MSELHRPGSAVAPGPHDGDEAQPAPPAESAVQPAPPAESAVQSVPPAESAVQPAEQAPADPAGEPAALPAQPGEGSATASEAAPDMTAPAQPAASVAPEVTAGEARRRRRRRDRIAAALIGVLTLLLGFAFAVQVHSTDTEQQLAGAREEDLVRILDELNAREDRLRQQIAEQQAALDQLNSSDSRSATALKEARQRAEAIGILNGTVAAQGPGLRITIRDPAAEVRVADLLDAIEELRGAGAETMQIDGIRVGVSSAVTGDPGALKLDGRPLATPYQILVIGSPQNMQTALNIPGGVVQRVTGRGGSVDVVPDQQVVVDALRPLDRPQYASPKSGG